MSIEFRKSITEVLDIINHMDKIYVDKIPKKFKEFLNENSLSTYNPKLDHSKSLEELNLSKDAKKILGVIYWKFWCDESQKIKFMKKLKQNEIEFEKKARQKYNPDNIFKKKKVV